MSSHVDRCHLVAAVLAADGIMTENERALLNKLMEKHGLSEDERRQVREFEGADGALERVRTLPVEKRRQIADEILEASLADMKLGPHERDLARALTQQLDLEDEEGS